MTTGSSSAVLSLPSPLLPWIMPLSKYVTSVQNEARTVCVLQARRIWAVKSMASLTMRASRSSPPVTPTATAEVEGWPVCPPAHWTPACPLQTAPAHSTSDCRGNAARSGCVKTSKTQSYRTPSQVNAPGGQRRGHSRGGLTLSRIFSHVVMLVEGLCVMCE